MEEYPRSRIDAMPSGLRNDFHRNTGELGEVGESTSSKIVESVETALLVYCRLALSSCSRKHAISSLLAVGALGAILDAVLVVETLISWCYYCRPVSSTKVCSDLSPEK